MNKILDSLKKNKCIIFIYENLMILIYYIYNFIYKNKFKIIGDLSTLDKIKKDKCNIARFGDGELDLIYGREEGYQKVDKTLSKRLKEVITSNEEKCLIGIIDVFNGLDELKDNSKRFWRINLGRNYGKWIKLLSQNKIYYNAHITRPYLRYKDDSCVEERFRKLRDLWDGEDVLIVEGEYTRIGYKNDFLENAKSIKRILCPKENSFNRYEEIYNAIVKHGKSKLILIALGPTASILCYDLSKNNPDYWAVDFGHADLEYEYFKRGMKDGGKIDYKYVNSNDGGRNVNVKADSQFESEVIERIL